MSTNINTITGGRPQRISRLTLRILAINVFAIAILFAGVLYLDRYQNSLIQSELEALAGQAEIFGRTIAGIAIRTDSDSENRLSNTLVRSTLRKVSIMLGKRVRVFSTDGGLVADSQIIGRPGGMVQIRELPPPKFGDANGFLIEAYERVVNWMPRRGDMPHYSEAASQHARHYQEVSSALTGLKATNVSVSEDGDLVLSAAVPLQTYRQVLGALMLSIDGQEIDHAIRSVRFEILGIFVVVLAITVFLSLYLAGSIIRPVQRLAIAAEQVTTSLNRHHLIPIFEGRQDEIGDLSRAISGMTEALWQRMDAVEQFAADVAHEIKNPLTSVRSAVESASRTDDPEKQALLLSIIVDDVARLDRLISDISDASRLDAELSRDVTDEIDLVGMLTIMAQLHSAKDAGGGVEVRYECSDEGDKSNTLTIRGHESRLVQVIRNLLGNAITFSPNNSTVWLRARRESETIKVVVEDEGPGIPSGKLDEVFGRFYSERPEGEKFGTHSGLGLSISRQIVEAHGGRIWAENCVNAQGMVTGARFTVSLPCLLS
jgi:two-component system, OmpR family, sensor histidine kinase ChvG